jgi:hypothetical protein
VANVSVAPGSAAVKAGEEFEVVVKVQRLSNYSGEFKVELVVPENARGISAPEVTIPKGKDEAKLVIRADADAAPGNRGALAVRATALVNGKVATRQEAKLTVKVVK